MTAWRIGAQLGRNRRTALHTTGYPAAGHLENKGQQSDDGGGIVLALQLDQQPDYEAIKSSMLLQASLAARVQHINATIRCVRYMCVIECDKLSRRGQIVPSSKHSDERYYENLTLF